MDITLYTLLFLTAIFTVYTALFYKQDRDIQIIFIIISEVLFIINGLNAFNIELTGLDNTGVWQQTAFTEYSFVLFNFLMAVISFLYGFMLVMERSKGMITREAS